jgi:Zn-finger nucleic acid-binding protein
LKCPTDGNILAVNKAEDHTGYGCECCKGSWLPKKYIESIRHTKKFEPDTFYTELLSHKNEVFDAMCPSNCGVLTTTKHTVGTSYCAVCSGVWFEANALKQMLARYNNKNSPLTGVDTPNIFIGLIDFIRAFFK